MTAQSPSRLGISLIPILTLIILLALDISIFGSDAILGASQVSLLFASGICVWLAMWRLKVPWHEFEEAIKGNIGDVTTAIVILFLIGGISGTWTMSGIVPTFIYYGVKIISPKIFLLTACVICAFVSLMIGSSWTTIATIGIALLGIGKAEGFSDGMIAGAIISGAYFGDKISPLSDTTVMASSMNKVPLFEHIRYMLFTTVPSITITLIIFLILGLSHSGADSANISIYTDTLAEKFNISPWLFIVPLLTAFMIYKKMPAIIVLAISIVTAVVAALVLQPGIMREIGSGISNGSGWKIMFTGVVQTIYDSVSLETGNPEVNELVSTRGMAGMLNTVYLIICAMCFGAAMKASGMLESLSRLILPLTKTRGGLVASTVTTGTALNGIVSDQYLSIILTSSVFKDIYEKEGYEGRLLSRAVEDSATVTSPLFPWSSCGMTQATILSVPTITYLPYCFFNIISPFMSVIVAITGYKIIRRLKKEEAPATQEADAQKS
ncbi:MAG: sodium:proton antiporter [Bacteroidales bacterium]|nr:sodium:proton antiporter [Bacteroidales bacterium]